MGAGQAVPEQGTEQKVDAGIDFAAQCAKMFGLGAISSEVEPLAMVGVHLGFAIAHLFHHVAKAKQQQPKPAAAPAPGQPG